MATKKALLVFTRYYKGEDKNPFESETPKYALWKYEFFWVRDTMEAAKNGEGSHAANKLQEILLEYFAYGLREFCSGDGFPIGLKAYIFHMHCRSIEMMDVTGFKSLYHEAYYNEG